MSVGLVAAAIASLLAGLFAWTLIEYAVHGPLSHRWRTFVSPLHLVHHKYPRRVFTSPYAAAPVALLLFGAASAAVGTLHASVFIAGVLIGFARYERIHWRIHFRAPRNPREQRLRAHHLAHHFRNPRAYWGVTTRIWDRGFGTLPADWRDDYARFDHSEPLTGPSNLRDVWNPRLVFDELRAAVTRRA